MLNPPTMDELCRRFFAAVPRYERVETMPEPYGTLLMHTNHMTVTVENYFQQLVDVEVLATDLTGSDYTRKILLRTQGSRRVVQFGIVLIDLETLDDKVRREILAGDTPLGRVLIQNNVLTRVEPMEYVRVTADEGFAEWFAIDAGTELYGRLGVIHAGERRAVEVLEVLAPISSGR